MKVYHGSSSPSAIEKARAIAPEWTHGYCWTPYKMTPHDTPYILDNGAFSAYKNGEVWDVDGFVSRLNQLPDMPREPEFVVLPDVVADSERTNRRAEVWAERIEYPTAFPVQDGHTPTSALNHAEKIDAETIFVGGTIEWKRRNAHDFVDEAHSRGLDVHVARPTDAIWPREIGADSFDTASYAAGAWERFEREIGQRTLTEATS